MDVNQFPVWFVCVCTMMVIIGGVVDVVAFDPADRLAQNTSTACHIDRPEYWQFINWYFGRSKIINVVVISQHAESHSYADTYTEVIRQLLQNCELPLTLTSRHLTYEDDIIGSSDRYSWQGNLFELRATQTPPATPPPPNRHKRSTPESSSTTTTTSTLTSNPPDRKDEPERGILVIVQTIQLLDEYLRGSARSPFRTPRANYIILVRFAERLDTWQSLVESVLQRLWQWYGIDNVFLMAPCADAATTGNDVPVATYLPFALAATSTDVFNVTSDPRPPLGEEMFGQCQWSDIAAIDFSMQSLRRLNNMNGYPFRVSIFLRYPTALPVDTISPIIAGSYFNRAIQAAGGFGGFDGIVLGNMAERLNFRTVVVPARGSDFGWVADNGSFYGSLGDVLYRRAQISFNGRFVADYGTDEVEFLYPVYFDQFCIISPKSLKIPQWLAIFKCFHWTVWVLFICTTIACAQYWYLLKRWTYRKSTHKRQQRVTAPRPSTGRPEFSVIFIEMWIIMLSAVSTQMPNTSLERIFMAACLLGNVIISGSFQGSLTTSFSTTAYYKDIDTLRELDASGLPIGTTSASLIDIFGDGDTPVLRSLISKFKLLTSGLPTIDQTAFNRDICCIERCADIRLIIVSKYELADGTQLLHAIKESPKTCHISYVVKKGWPFTAVFEEMIHRFSEAGLIQKWYYENQDSIIQQTRIDRRSTEETLRVLVLADVQTAFYILGFGLLFCIGLFVWEIVSVRWLSGNHKKHFSRRDWND